MNSSARNESTQHTAGALASNWGLRIIALMLASLFVTSAHADKFELENGDTFEAEVLERTDEKIVVQHPVFGRLEIPADQIKKVPVKGEEPGVGGTWLLRGWKRTFGLGFSGARGNSESAAFNASLKLIRETDEFRGTFDTAFFYGSQQGTTNTQEYYGRYRHDFLFSDSRFLLFGSARYDYDNFQGWQHRVSGQAGVGYDLLEHDKLDLRTDIGFGVARTFGSEQDTKPEGVAGLAFKWIITKGQTFSADVTYYPNFKNLPEFRLLGNASYDIALGLVDGLSLSVGLKDEYRSDLTAAESALGGQKNNLKYFGNIVYDF